MGYHQLRSKQLTVNDSVPEFCIIQSNNGHSPLSTRFTTTFPVSGPANIETRYIFSQQNKSIKILKCSIFGFIMTVLLFKVFSVFDNHFQIFLLEIIFSKPLSSADIQQYQQSSQLHQRNNPEHTQSSRNVTQVTGSSLNLRRPPPAYPVAVRNGIFSARSPLGNVITSRTELRMDAFNYYSEKTNGKKKNATAV